MTSHFPSACYQTCSKTVSLRREETVERSVNNRAFGFHRGSVERTGIIEVSIDREPVETVVKEVENLSALEDETIHQDPIPCDQECRTASDQCLP